LEEQKTALRNLGRDQLFASLRGASVVDPRAYEGMRTPSVGSGNTPDWAGMSVSSEGMQSAEYEYGGESSASLGGGGGAAAEMYMMNRPLERPIIRDRPRAEPRLPRRVRQPPATEAKRVQISAADLRASISSATGLARSRYKLPSSRVRYADVQAALGRTAGSSADLIAALKEAGVNLAET
jgi:hypothetical protein